MFLSRRFSIRKIAQSRIDFDTKCFGNLNVSPPLYCLRDEFRTQGFKIPLFSGSTSNSPRVAPAPTGRSSRQRSTGFLYSLNLPGFASHFMSSYRDFSRTSTKSEKTHHSSTRSRRNNYQVKYCECNAQETTAKLFVRLAKNELALQVLEN